MTKYYKWKLSSKYSKSLQINGQLLIAALADEEAASPDGVDYGISYLLDEKLIDPTHAIVPDIGHEMKEIDIAEKGRLVIKITTIGKQAHASTPDKGIIEIQQLIDFALLSCLIALELLKWFWKLYPLSNKK